MDFMTALTLTALNKSYGPVQALRDLSLEVGAGEIVGFVGSNGAGKSTAMRITLGVVEADSGEVRWDGRLIDLAVRRRIGYMPEERGLYPRMRVGEQLSYLARLHGLDGASATVSMEHWTEVLGIAERRGDEVLKLSLGNQQRVQLAAALIHHPEILVLDEPFSGLDPVAVDVMSGVLREQAAAGVPVLFSSHQLDLVESLCDRVGIIKSGSLVAFGDIEELRRTDTRRWVVDGPPHQSWLPSVPSADLVSSDGSRTVVEVLDPALTLVDQELLTAALAAGPVHEFSRLRPSLTELYRHVVSAPTEGVRQEVNA